MSFSAFTKFNMWATLRNKCFSAFMYLYSLYVRVKLILGYVKVKHGIMQYYEAHGLNLSSFIHHPKRVEAIKTYSDFRPDDVILLTYPKSGTHFTGEIIASIYKECGKIDSTGQIGSTMKILEITPFFNPRGGLFTDLDMAPSPRTIYTHLPWRLLPNDVQQGKVKIIHCLRNPKDVACSYYPFLRSVRVLDLSVSWDDYVRTYVKGNGVYCGYFDFLKQWYPHRNDPNVLNIEFESMKKDLGESVRAIAKFLDIELSEDQIKRIVFNNTFENKKKQAGEGHIMYRKGKSGGWKSKVTVEQNEMLDEWIQREMEEMQELSLQWT